MKTCSTIFNEYTFHIYMIHSLLLPPNVQRNAKYMWRFVYGRWLWPPDGSTVSLEISDANANGSTSLTATVYEVQYIANKRTPLTRFNVHVFDCFGENATIGSVRAQDISLCFTFSLIHIVHWNVDERNGGSDTFCIYVTKVLV